MYPQQNLSGYVLRGPSVVLIPKRFLCQSAGLLVRRTRVRLSAPLCDSTGGLALLASLRRQLLQAKVSCQAQKSFVFELKSTSSTSGVSGWNQSRKI